MRYRQSKIKQEHSMIKGLKALLTKLSKVAGVSAIIPGRISPSKVKALHLTVQYRTKEGVRLLAKGDGIQEVFVITTQPETLITFIEAL